LTALEITLNSPIIVGHSNFLESMVVMIERINVGLNKIELMLNLQ
jgi:hypothetical protein